MLNLLWLAGAEAVSLNGERVVATTSIYCVGSTILVNDTRLSPPYEFLAIGDPARARDGHQRSGQPEGAQVPDQDLRRCSSR